MEMYQIKYFLATCETLNFTKAAEAANVSQPALTKAIKLLEDELGAQLFDRQKRPLRLTELGSQLKGKFVTISKLSKEIKAQASLFRDFDNASFTLGVANTIGADRFSSLIGNLQRRLPGIVLSVLHGGHSHLISNLRDGLIELAILADCGTLDNDLDYETLYKEDYALAVPPGHVLAQKPQVSLADLQGVGYVHRQHCELNGKIDQMLRERGIEIKTHLSTDQDDLARHMIAAGLGVSLMPQSLVRDDIVACRLADEGLYRTITLARFIDRVPTAISEKVGATIMTEFRKDHDGIRKQ